MTLKHYITAILFFFSAFVIAQDFEFTASVSKKKLGINQRLKMVFSVNKSGADNFKMPNFSAFKVVAGPSSSVSQSWVNGKTSYSHSYTFIIEPKTLGTFTIPAATIEYDGKVISANTVSVTVTKKIDVPKNPNDPNYIAQENIFLVASLSKSNPYVGESVYVEYRLYFSKDVGFGNAQFGEIPKYEGFWNQEIPMTKQEVKNGKLKGEDYRYYTLKKAVLIPQKSGKLYVDPIKMDMIVNVPTGRYDFFGNAQTRNVSASYTSGRKLVNVKALPIANKPENFTGAVGDFNLDVTSSKIVLKANESTQITVTITGKGNLKLFEIPEISVPAELEVYTPERKQKVMTTLTGLKGSITDSYAIVPEYKGKYKIPSVSFSYFSPKDNQYHSLTSDNLIIDVTEGKVLPSTATDSTVSKQVVKNTGGDFRFIQTETTFEPPKTADFYKSQLFYGLLIAPLLAIPFGIFIGRKRKKKLADVLGNKIRTADKLARKYLSDAKKQLKNKDAFYVALEKALHNFLKARLHIETSDISQDKIADLLKENHVKVETVNEFISVLNDCDFARYAPTTDFMMKEEYNKAAKIISKINSELR